MASMKSDPASYSRALLGAFGQTATRACPEFEKLFGWPLPDAVLPFARPLAAGALPSEGVLEFRREPWSRLAALSSDPKKALDYFLSGFGAHALVLGLLPFAKYKGDVDFVDVAPGGAGETFMHNHEVGVLEANSEPLAAFVRHAYLDCTEEEPGRVRDRVEALKGAPRPDAKRVRQIADQYEAAAWLLDLFRGETRGWPRRGKAEPKLAGPFAVHWELLVASVTGDAARAAKAVAAAGRAKGLLTRALAERVEANFAKPAAAKLGWLKAEHLRTVLPKEYGAAAAAATAAGPGEREPLAADALARAEALSRSPTGDPKAWWLLGVQLESHLAMRGMFKMKDDWRLHEGERLAKAFPANAAVVIDDRACEDGTLPDMLLADVRIVSARVRQVLEALGVKDLEFLPLAVKSEARKVLSKSYFVLNPVATSDVIDRGKSGVQMSALDESAIFRVKKLVLVPERLAKAPRIARAGGQPRWILVHDSVRQAFKACGIADGWKYVKAQGWDGLPS
jgi:uncharacterized protein DUF1629